MKDPTRGGAGQRAARDGREERRRHRARRGGAAGRGRGARRRRAARHRSAARRQRRQGGDRRAAGRRRARARGAARAPARPRRGDRRHLRSIRWRVPWCSTPGSAGGWWPSRKASCCRGYADARSTRSFSRCSTAYSRRCPRGTAPPSTGCGCASVSCRASRSSCCRPRTRCAAKAPSARTRPWRSAGRTPAGSVRDAASRSSAAMQLTCRRLRSSGAPGAGR